MTVCDPSPHSLLPTSPVVAPAPHRPSRGVVRGGLALAAACWLAPTVALAQDPGPVSADPEMVNIRFGEQQIPGVPTPRHADTKNTIHAGTFFQYELNPVTGYRLDEFYANIVVNRLQTNLGVTWDFAKFGSWRLVVPFAINAGTQIEELKAVGVGFNDIYTGVSLTPVQVRTKQFGFNFGVHGDIWLPIGAKDAYMGERSVRGNGGVSFLFDVANVLDVVGDASVTGRRYFNTGQDFEQGSELWLSEGVRIKLPWLQRDKWGLQITQSLIARGGFPNFFQGGAENGIEVLGGVAIPIRNIGFNTGMTIDAMAGRGTSQGYGTTDLRVMAGLTFYRIPGRKPRAEPLVVVEPPPPTLPPPPEEIEIPEPPPEPPPPEVRVYLAEDQIIIRDPIEFFVDTADIKPESLGILSSVADIMNSQWRIKHVVIEGHASEEGSFEYNYELSTRRAESIFKQLIRDGVSPDRLSYKGYGEVKPKVEGSTEEAYAINRRVEFKVVGQWTTADTKTDPPRVPTTYGESTKLPWSGEASPLRNPPSWKSEADAKKAAEEAEKAAAEAAKRKAEARDQFREDDDEEIVIEPQKPAPQRPPAEEKKDEFEGEKFEDDDDAAPPAPVEAPAPAEPTPSTPPGTP
jgi:outer membrane protein OmpA-like peptidoglycan-associated protein